MEIPGALVKKGNGYFPVSGVCGVVAAAAFGGGEPDAMGFFLWFELYYVGEVREGRDLWVGGVVLRWHGWLFCCFYWGIGI